MSATTLAQWSNMAVYSAMFVLIMALMAFAAGFASRGRRVGLSAATPQAVPVGVGAGGPDSTFDDPRAA
ncbi:MAG: hypothetical protein VW239_11070, partial [Candidatus Nanopelagicales bacterium]